MENNTVSQNNKLYWVYLIGFFLILALPVLNLPPWFSPPDWGKTIVFRIILSILLFLFIYQLLFQHDKKFTIVEFLPQRKDKVFWPFWLVIALLGVYFLATLFSLDIRFSLWGSPYRSGGFVNFAFYIIFAILSFLILRQKDWQKIWDFGIIVGILVSLVAIFQNFSIFSQIFISRKIEIVSTVGLPSALGIYLLLLGFLTFSFLLKEKKLWKKFFYLISFFFLFSGIALSHSQAAYLGTVVAFVWFLFFYDSRGIKKIILLKIIAAILIIVGFGGLYFLKTHPKNPLSKNSIISALTSWGMDQSRLSAWKVSLGAVKERPTLGYGPENFNIGFDKYYNPSLPKIEKDPDFHSSWWDRAHNFIFDIAVTAGIPALIIYLLLFGTLFWQLQKLKYYPNLRMKSESTNNPNAVVAHGIQAAFIGYLVANFFSFDTFSTYLISFLLIVYSLHLISSNQVEISINQQNPHKSAFSSVILEWRGVIIGLLFLALIWFIWQYNMKPFQINTQIKIAEYWVNNNKCEQAFVIMEKILPKKSFLDSHLRLKYVDYLRSCEAQHPEKTAEYAQKGAKLLKENIKIQPYYTRNWLALADCITVLINKETNPEIRQELIKEGNYYLEKAEELSPKRQEVLIGWTQWGFVSGEYQIMREKSQNCIEVNQNLADCYWFNGLSEIVLGNLKEGKKNLEIAEEKGYDSNSISSLHQLVKAYSSAKNYQELAETYQRLIKINPKQAEYHASLAFTYRELGQFNKAREEALIVLELMPEAREEVETFLKTLK